MKRTKLVPYNGGAFVRPRSRREIEPFYRLSTVDGIPSYRECSAAEIINAGIEFSERAVGAETLNAPSTVRAYLHTRLAHLPYEMFAAVLLDNRHRVIEYRELFRGTIDGASVHPREVVRDVLACNAAAVIFAHNHPSGVAEPSQADELITRRLRDALSLIDVRVLDHILIAGSSMMSFAERGLL